MDKLFWGAVLLLLDWDLTTASGNVIGLIPDFLGYILMIFGAKEVNHWSKNFRKLEKTAMVFAIYAGISWIQDALNVTGGTLSFVGIVLGIMSVVIRMLSLWWIIKGLLAVEEQTGFELKASFMKIMWLCLTVVTVITFFAGLIPVLRDICGIAAMILAVCFLAAFFRTKCYFDDAMAEMGEE